MNELKKFVRVIGILGIASLLSSISPLVLLPYLTNNLTSVDYGVFVQFSTTITILPAIAILGLPYSFVRYMSASKCREDIQKSFYSIALLIAIVSIIIGILLCIGSVTIANSIFNGNITVGLLLPITIIFSAFILLFYDVLRTFRKDKIYSLFTIFQAYLTVIIVVLFLFKGHNIQGAVLGILFAQIIIFCLMLIIIINIIGFTRPSFHGLKKYLKFGIPTIPSNLSTWILDASDRYIINFFIGLSFVGYYSGGYLLGNLINVLLSPFFTILLPILSIYYSIGDKFNIKRYLNHSIKLFLVVAIPITFILSVLSKNLLLLLATPEIAVQGHFITPIVAVGGIFYGLYGIITQIIVLEHKTKLTGKIWIISAVLNVLIDVTMGYVFGIIGIAISTLLIFMFAFLMTSYFSFKYIKCNFYYKFILKAVGSSVAISILIFLINPIGIINLSLTIIGSLVIYLFLMILMKGIKMYEFWFLIEILRGQMDSNHE
jgi:O-antigen/teichoic acid export membrane protein